MKQFFSLLSLIFTFLLIACNSPRENYSERTMKSEVKELNAHSKVIVANEMHKLEKETKFNRGKIERIESSMEDSRDL